MSEPDLHVNLYDLILPLAITTDMMSPAVANHHMKVAYLTLRLAEELEFSPLEQCSVVTAAALHDIGAFSLSDRIDLLEFELKDPKQHANAGYLLLREFPPFEEIAKIVKYHHVPWNHGRGEIKENGAVSRGAHLVHLADRTAVLIPRGEHVLRFVDTICESIREHRGSRFVPEYVDALDRLAHRDYIWLELASGSMERALRKSFIGHIQELDLDMLLAFAQLMCRVIDFKSEFTATHSSGLVAVSAELARLRGFSSEDCQKMRIAAYLHDVGKLAVPSEVLEKPARLSEDEWHIMRSHVYYTYHILESFEALGPITNWSALHQERLDGTGYPFGYRAVDLPHGSRIMAVSDVFVAITEDRPYREGMPPARAQAILTESAKAEKLDPDVVQTLLDHYDEMSAVRSTAQEQARAEYRAFQEELQ